MRQWSGIHSFGGFTLNRTIGRLDFEASRP
jgi:hypothetical protein